MDHLYDVWYFTRQRLDQSIEELSEEQAAWRPYPGAHSIVEMVYHIAGAEHWMATRLLGLEPEATERDAKIDRSVRASFITDDPFPFSPGECSLADARLALDETAPLAERVLREPGPDILEKPLETPLGPVVPGVGGLWRIAQHAAYHTGQIWTYRSLPGFPTS
ncbi:MAG: DinB family protein [Fimbriimonadaceae bacterium]